MSPNYKKFFVIVKQTCLKLTFHYLGWGIQLDCGKYTTVIQIETVEKAFLLDSEVIEVLWFGDWMSLKDLYVKGLVPRKHYWKVVATLRGGAYWECLWSLRACSQRDCGILVSFLSLLPGHEVSSIAPPCASTMTCCLVTDPKQHGQFIMDWILQIYEPK